MLVSDCNIYILKVFDRNLEANFLLLYKALVDIYEIGVDIVNLSLGLESNLYVNQMTEICDMLKKKNCILVTTASNSGEKSYLLDLESVIKVIGGKGIVSNNLYYYDSQFYIKSYPRFLPWKDNTMVFLGGNSFSVPLVIPLIVQCMKYHNQNCENILRWIKSRAIQVNNIEKIIRPFDISNEECKDYFLGNIIDSYLVEKIQYNRKQNMLFAYEKFSPFEIADILIEISNLLEVNIKVEDFYYWNLYYRNNLVNRFHELIWGV